MINEMGMNKRGLSNVIVTLIIIVISLIAVGLVWVVVQNLIEGETDEISLGFVNVDLEIKEVKVQGNNTEVKVKRKVGEGEISGLKFIVIDGVNTKVIDKKNVNLSQLEEKTFILTSAELGNIVVIKEISVAPVFKLGSGEEKIGNVVDKMEFSIESCLDILKKSISKGDGNYLIYPNEEPIEVYCDMTTDDGGWTLMTMSSGVHGPNVFRTTTSNRDVSNGNVGTDLTLKDGTWYNDIRWGPSNAQSTDWSDVANPVYNKQNSGTTSWFKAVGQGGVGFTPATNFKCSWQDNYVLSESSAVMYALDNFPSAGWNIPNPPVDPLGGSSSWDAVLPGIHLNTFSKSVLSKTWNLAGIECNSGDARSDNISLWVR